MNRRTNGAIRMWRAVGRALLAVVLAVTALAGVPITASAGTWGGPPVREINGDGRAEEFWVDTTTREVLHAWATTPDGRINSGAYLMGVKASSGIGVGRNEDDRIEIFFRADSGEIHHMWQLEVNGTTGWSGPGASLGGQVRRFSPVYGRNISGGRIQVQITDVNGVTRYKWQGAPNCCWTASWTTTHP